jgi:hypothetical protein
VSERGTRSEPPDRIHGCFLTDGRPACSHTALLQGAGITPAALDGDTFAYDNIGMLLAFRRKR